MPGPFLAPGDSESKKYKKRRNIRAFSTPSPGDSSIRQKEVSIVSAESFHQHQASGRQEPT